MSLLKALLAAVLMAGGITAACAETFRFEALGIEVTKPTRWRVMTEEDRRLNAQRVEAGNAWYQAAVASSKDTLLVAFMKYPEPLDDFNPNFQLGGVKGGILAGKNPVDILAAMLANTKLHMSNLVIVEPPRRTVLSKLPAAYTRYRLQLTADNKPFVVNNMMWVIPRGDQLLMVGGATREDQKNGKRAEVQAIVNTVRISKQMPQ